MDQTFPRVFLPFSFFPDGRGTLYSSFSTTKRPPIIYVTHIHAERGLEVSDMYQSDIGGGGWGQKIGESGLRNLRTASSLIVGAMQAMGI